MIPRTHTLLVQVGRKGMSVIVLGPVRRSPPRFVTSACCWIPDSTFGPTRLRALPEMKRLMAGYQEQLKVLGFAGLGLYAAANPLAETNGRYVGSQKCEACHETSYDVWKQSGHAHAYKTLETQDPPRNYDPECISCHVVGWEPTKFFPYKGGFEGSRDSRLKNVGCEDCHGPGEKHCIAEDGDNECCRQCREAVRTDQGAGEGRSECTTCHDLDNSPRVRLRQVLAVGRASREKHQAMKRTLLCVGDCVLRRGRLGPRAAGGAFSDAADPRRHAGRRCLPTLQRLRRLSRPARCRPREAAVEEFFGPRPSNVSHELGQRLRHSPVGLYSGERPCRRRPFFHEVTLSDGRKLPRNCWPWFANTIWPC